MEREETNNASMFSRVTEKEGLHLQPINLGVTQILQEKGNRLALNDGKSVDPTAKEINELAFVMTNDIETVLAVSEDEWRNEIIRYGSRLSARQLEVICKHFGDESAKVEASETTSTPGKRKRPARSR